jgi:hypothetical protein
LNEELIGRLLAPGSTRTISAHNNQPVAQSGQMAEEHDELAGTRRVKPEMENYNAQLYIDPFG